MTPAAPANEQSPLRVAVIGCGAISRDFHIPVLAGHDGVRLVAFVDRDVARISELARAYKVETVLSDARDLDPKKVDAALIATPPFHHAPCTIDLARRGIHVLVEKPMALTLADAQAMVAAAREAGVVLAVGLFRRLYPSMRMLRALIESQMLGRPIGFDIEAGSVYGWPLTTLANMRKDQGGGGVFLDIAPHLLDQLLFALPGDPELVDYQDNALGGIESDCLLHVRIRQKETTVEGRVELSRTRKLRNTIRMQCERGVLELGSGERFRVSIQPDGLELTDSVRDDRRPHQIQASWADEPESLGYQAYREQIDDWLGAIRHGRASQLSGESALQVVGFIEECYRKVRHLPEPWSTVENRATETVPAQPRGTSPRRVLVTGATGFIGCRVAEILQLREGWDVRGLVRNPGSASRLARMPVEMVIGNLHSQKDLVRAVEGCDAVVHGAIGTAYGQRREIFDVTVGGTRRLAEAARAAGVKRFVHISTVALHGREVSGILDESTPIKPPPGDDYSESKAKAEQVITQAVKAGLPAVTLRLANVYGPHGSTLISRPLPLLMKGALTVLGGDRKPCNMVYVDNVAQAIICALEAPAEAAIGQTFTISDGEELTWLDFYGYFASALGVAAPRVTGNQPIPNPPSRRGPFRWIGAWFGGWKEVFSSSEAKSLAKRYLQTDPVGTLPRLLLERCPGVERGLRRLFKFDKPLLYQPQQAKQAGSGSMIMNPIEAFISPARARKQIGFTAAVSPARAREWTLSWARSARLVPASGPPVNQPIEPTFEAAAIGS
jgi:predicted dehydrogenase/nucleoside-diphosphate-sugar epimerase